MDDCVVALPVAATDSGIGGASAGGAGGISGAGGGIGSTEGGTGGTGGSSNKAAGRSAVAGAGDDGDGDGVSGDDDNTDDEKKKKKRRRAAQTTEELRVATVMKATGRYNAIARGYEWVVNSKEALDKYLLDGACLVLSCLVSSVTRPSVSARTRATCRSTPPQASTWRRRLQREARV